MRNVLGPLFGKASLPSAHSPSDSLLKEPAVKAIQKELYARLLGTVSRRLSLRKFKNTAILASVIVGELSVPEAPPFSWRRKVVSNNPDLVITQEVHLFELNGGEISITVHTRPVEEVVPLHFSESLKLETRGGGGYSVKVSQLPIETLPSRVSYALFEVEKRIDSEISEVLSLGENGIFWSFIIDGDADNLIPFQTQELAIRRAKRELATRWIARHKEDSGTPEAISGQNETAKLALVDNTGTLLLELQEFEYMSFFEVGIGPDDILAQIDMAYIP